MIVSEQTLDIQATIKDFCCFCDYVLSDRYMKTKLPETQFSFLYSILQEEPDPRKPGKTPLV